MSSQSAAGRSIIYLGMDVHKVVCNASVTSATRVNWHGSYRAGELTAVRILCDPVAGRSRL